MDTVKNAIVRVGRRVQVLDKLTTVDRRRRLKYPEVKREKVPRYGSLLTNEEIDRFLPLANQRREFQDYLKPLGISNHKLFNEGKIFDEAEAQRNWKLKTSSENLIMFKNYFDNKPFMEEILSLMIELTPPDLFHDRNEASYIKVLKDFERQNGANKFHVDRYYFHDIPAIPTTNPEFEHYIYFLTHSNIMYADLSSMNGIVNDVLLYTHNLDNNQFKSLRTVNTFNWMIKYYGLNKNQSSFARSLLLVLNKDGKLANIDTYNTLLKMIAMNSRSISNHYKLIVKYLKLIKNLNLHIDLRTWNIVYSLITDYYLKEMYLSQLSLINLPITRELVYKILDDYTKLDPGQDKVIEFLNNEVNYKSWAQDSKILNKVIYYHIKKDINYTINYNLNQYSLKYILEGIRDSDNTNEDKLAKMLLYYKSNQQPIDQIPIIYKHIIGQMLTLNHSLEPMTMVMKGLVEDCKRDIIKNDDIDEEKIMSRIVGQKYNIMKMLIQHNNIENNPQTPQAWRQLKEIFNYKPFDKNIDKLLAINKFKLIRSINSSKINRLTTTIDQRLRERKLIESV